MMERFGDYFFYLLTTPLKKARKAANQFYIFFKVIGKLYDAGKRDILRVREEAMIVSASEIMLPEFGKDYSMRRLKSETMPNYRKRLLMKSIIAEQAGTRHGILLALAALGYEQSYIEPFYMLDCDRWAEFIVFLRGAAPSTINDLLIIDNEVMKVKQASSKPAYGVEAGNQITIDSSWRSGEQYIPLCGTIVCGVYPDIVDIGKMNSSNVEISSTDRLADAPFALTNRTLAAEFCYQEYQGDDQE